MAAPRLPLRSLASAASRRSFATTPARLNSSSGSGGSAGGAGTKPPRSTSQKLTLGAGAAALLVSGKYASDTLFTKKDEGRKEDKEEGVDRAKQTVVEPLVGKAKHSLPDISKLDASLLDDTSAPMRQRMETYVKLLQHRIVESLSAEETGSKGFFVDSWLRKEGGEGISCVLQDGRTFDKAGVNISIVHGTLPARAVVQMSADHAGLLQRVGYTLATTPDAEGEVEALPFYATGLSLVVHPANPSAPTVHFNYRYFELTHPKLLKDGSPNPRFDAAHPDAPVAWWFGGGTDLTPTILFPEDAQHFHGVLKATADAHDKSFYPAWKRWCDRYFWLPHRSETRGVGGIFFDDLTIPPGGPSARLLLCDGKPNGADTTPNEVLPTIEEHTRETLFSTVQALGNAFIPAYLPLLRRRKNAPSTPELERWQALRRGRYVEFNLVYDRGTKFGLQTPGARFESILMSLPLKARWEYMEKNSGVGNVGSKDEGGEQNRKEVETMEVLRKPREWAQKA